MLLLRITQSIIIAINTLLLVITSTIVSDPGYATGLGQSQFQSIVKMMLNAHGSGYDIALIFFGIHLVVLGFMIIKSGFLPKVPGIFLLFASIGYIIDSVANLVLPAGSELISMTATILILVAVIAEVTISVFLIVKSNKLSEQV